VGRLYNSEPPPIKKKLQFFFFSFTPPGRYSTRYINDRFLPDKAIDLMDEAGAMVQLASWETVLEGKDVRPAVNESHIAEVA
jgi:ATP-dependent Clp protease ATP-binding subunit ClpA